MKLRLPRFARPASGPPPREPSILTPLDEGQTRALIQFMAELGAAMNGAGDPTTFVRRSLNRIGNAYGLRNLAVFALPTLLLLRFGGGGTSFIELSGRTSADLRLEQITDLHRLVNAAEQGDIPPEAALQRLRTILASAARFPVMVRIAGAGLTAAGISLVLEPSTEEVIVCAALGVLAGLIEQGGSRWPRVWPLVPAAAGFIVGAIAFFLIDQGLESRGLRVIVPPLAAFLPGAALTVAMIELANGDVVAGGSRLAYGFVRLMLLVFGVVIAAQWIGLPSAAAPSDSLPLAELAAPAGVLIFTAGVCLHYSAPPRSFGWFLLVVAAAFLGEQFGGLFFAGYLSGFFGGAAMILAAQSIQVNPNAPPLVASLTPAFWLLVPGAIGVEGLTVLTQDNSLAGVADLVAMILTMISIALGVLLGLLLSGSQLAQEPT